ncbi:pentatricopeptide repeat-containing protein At3g16010-like [Eutrema salsugineum]|uniref:pentatricopeptide repeat-containing protein At3g16010-like n=1 Tax=Eutrema salsugineum TaxID=72664 RepID=UPI000CED2A05|nr:pentatricopeptide repeat-containing protein At3g16010-like [Eutrema salsugineum]
MSALSTYAMRAVVSRLSTLSCHLSQRQTENKIFQMFSIPKRSISSSLPPHLYRRQTDCSYRRYDPFFNITPPGSEQAKLRDRSVRMFGARFTMIMEELNWERAAAISLWDHQYRVDHAFVLSVLEFDFGIQAKIRFFNWAAHLNRRQFRHDSATYMALIRSLEDARLDRGIYATIQALLSDEFVAFSPAHLSELVEILGRAKMVSQALSVFYLAKGRYCEPTLSTYYSIFVMLMQQGWHKKAREVYTEMNELK